MKTLVKMMVLFSSLSLMAESPAIKVLPTKDTPNAFQKTSEKIIGLFNDSEDIFIIGTATVGIHMALDYIAVLAHEYGHAIPSIMTGNDYTVEITRNTGNIIFPFNGRCTTYTGVSPFITILLGPVAGIATTYFQCLFIKNLYNKYIQDKTSTESDAKVLESPIAFFASAVNTGEKYCSALLNSESVQPDPKNELACMANILICVRTMNMIADSIYGFLPYKTSGEISGDGEKIWQMILGSQPPTFKIDLGSAAIGVMAMPFMIGAMKAAYKKITQKPADTKKTENISQSDQIAVAND